MTNEVAQRAELNGLRGEGFVHGLELALHFPQLLKRLVALGGELVGALFGLHARCTLAFEQRLPGRERGNLPVAVRALLCFGRLLRAPDPVAASNRQDQRGELRDGVAGEIAR